MAAKRMTNGRVSPTDVARRAVEHLAALTGRPVEGVLGMHRDDNGWTVTIELVELRRVPDSTDVLASYDVALDAKGELTGYERTHRYYRSQVEDN